jgi:Ca2+-transporting ATPase
MTVIKHPYKANVEDVLAALGVSPEEGLTESDARARLGQYGPNRLTVAKRESSLTILLNQLRSMIVLLLIAAAFLSFTFGDWAEGIAVVIVIILNTAIGFFTEIRAVRSMEALYKLVRIDARVRRSGEISVVHAEELVPGDVVVLEAGDMAPADIRLIEASRMESNESALTGESVPVSKDTEPVAWDALPAERSNMVFMGTALTKGSGEGVVTSTGLDTELGRISVLAESTKEYKTPLEVNLDRLGNTLIWVTLILASIVVAAGAITGRDLLLMVKTGIALAVAAIPEGLPVVATIALARGMLRMARRNALVNRLSAVETLGSTNVICTDKTGTLTENRMTVELIVTEGGTLDLREGVFPVRGLSGEGVTDHAARKVLETGALCSRASLGKENASSIGDPMEIALLAAGERAGVRRDDLLTKHPETRVEAFDNMVNMMATFHESDGVYRVAIKGAPYAVLDCSDHVLTPDGPRELDEESKESWRKKNEELASRGYRVLAHAEKTVSDAEARPYKNLTFLGLVCLLDPPRPGIRESIRRCIRAGIKVVMVTGDHPSTARNIAHAVGLTEKADEEVVHGRDLKKIEDMPEQFKRSIAESLILARVSPEQKLELVKFYQEEGFVVAMTGDGVNDAPALKQADIGIAMGKRGTQVAKEAADVVLKDDSFGTIVLAVEQGRIIFGNIRKFIYYLLSCNVSEIMVVTVASFAPIPLPILPLQILFLNLVTDVFPALALGMGEGDERVMSSPPRDRKEPIITNRNWLGIAGFGSVITAAVLGGLVFSTYKLGFVKGKAVSVSFLTLAFAQIVHVFNMRSMRAGLLRNAVTRNAYVWGAVVLCAFIILGAVYIKPVSEVLSIVNPGLDGWILVVISSLLPLIAGQAWMYLRKL